MDIEIIPIRICQCIDDLGLLLDQIYKFPQKQREAYFQKIQSMKNKLLILKSNLRENNAFNTEKQYKQIYLSMNALKNQISIQQNALIVAKENKDMHNRNRDYKETRRSYDDAMKLIVEKEQEIRFLKKQLYDKEQLIKMNFEQLNRLKTDFQVILEENRRLKFEHTSLQIDLETANASISRTSDVTLQYKIREQEKDKVFQSALEELERLKSELIEANQKINHFEQLAQINIKKTKMVEQNIKKVERQAQDLNESYRTKESLNFRKLKGLGQLEFQISNKAQQVKQLQFQNRRLREDIQVLEDQIDKINKFISEQKIKAIQEKQKWHLDQERLNSDIENGLIRQSELRRVIQESQKKYLIVINKLNVAEELKVKNKQLQIRNQLQEERMKRVQQLLEESKKQRHILMKDKQKITIQMENQQRTTRQIQIQNLKFSQKAKIKDEEKLRLIQELQIYQNKIKEIQKQLVIREVSLQSLQAKFIEEKGNLINFEQKHRIKDKQIQKLKIKLLQAKIQTIHQIREIIN